MVIKCKERFLPPDPFLGVHPLQRTWQDLAHYFPRTLILWVCTPSIPRLLGHNALDPLFYALIEPTLLPCPCPPVLFALIEQTLFPCLGFEPRLVGCVIHPWPLSVYAQWLCDSVWVGLYIGAVVNAREILLQLKRPFFVTKKTFFFKSLWRAHARKEEGKLCGEVVKTRCETIKYNGPVFIWCIKSIYNVETMNLQLFEHYMSKKCNFEREWCGNGAGWRKHVILRGKYDIDSAKCSSVCGLSYAMSITSF